LTATALLEAVGESQATADALATVASLIGEVDAGARLPEQAFDARTFLDRPTTESSMTIAWSEPGECIDGRGVRQIPADPSYRASTEERFGRSWR